MYFNVEQSVDGASVFKLRSMLLNSTWLVVLSDQLHVVCLVTRKVTLVACSFISPATVQIIIIRNNVDKPCLK